MRVSNVMKENVGDLNAFWDLIYFFGIRLSGGDVVYVGDLYAFRVRF